MLEPSEKLISWNAQPRKIESQVFYSLGSRSFAKSWMGSKNLYGYHPGV